MPKVIFEFEHCRGNKNKFYPSELNCPYSDTERTPRSGYAMDYFCLAVSPKRITSGYVEWSSDINPVPEWCPFRMDKKEVEKEKQKEIEKQVCGYGI